MNQKTESPITFLQQALYSPSPPDRLPDGTDQQIVDLYEDLISIRRFIKNMNEGNLSASLSIKGYLGGLLKAQQANLRHMTWQTQRIAKGDFDQHLDFLGDFSTAFNKMTLQLKKAQQTLTKSEAHYRKLTDTMLDVMCTIDASTLRYSFISPSIMSLAGYRPREVMEMSFQDLFTEESAAYISRIMTKYRSRLANEKDQQKNYDCTIEAELKRKDHTLIWTEIIAHFVWDPHAQEVFINAVMRDLSQRKELQDKLEVQATMDDLTGIPNRRYFFECTKKQIKKSQESGEPMSFLMIDIDHFKKINDACGHSVGDTMLKIVSDICHKALRSTDKIGRIGGEEFAIFMQKTDLNQGLLAAERIRKCVEKNARTEYGQSLITATISIGITQLLPDEDSLHSLLIRTDKLLYTAKAKGRNQVCHSSEIIDTDEYRSPWEEAEDESIS